MLLLTVTSASPVAFGEESGLAGLDTEAEFYGVDQDATTRIYPLSNAAWDRVRPRLRDLSRRRVPNLDGNGAPILGSLKPLLSYTLVQVPGNHPRFTVLQQGAPLTTTADGVILASGINLLGGTQAKLDLTAQSTAALNVTTGQARFNPPVKALRLTAVPFGPRGLSIGVRVKAASGSGSVEVIPWEEQEIRITITPAAGANTATAIAAQIIASTAASYYITPTVLSGSTKIGPTYIDPATTSIPPQLRRKEYLYLGGGDGGGLAELLVPVLSTSVANGLLVYAQKGGNTSNGISLKLVMNQGGNSVVVTGNAIVVNRTGATETLANLVSAINGNANAAALVRAEARGTGSLGDLAPRYLYGGAGEDPNVYVGGAEAVVTEHTNTSMVITVDPADLAAAGGDIQKSVMVQATIGDRLINSQVEMGAERRAATFRAAVRTQANLDLSAPGATIDSVTMAAGMRIWATSQSTGTQDGLYVWNGAAVPATRAPEMDDDFDASGVLVTITGGTDVGKVALCTNAPGAGIINTDALTDALV